MHLSHTKTSIEFLEQVNQGAIAVRQPLDYTPHGPGNRLCLPLINDLLDVTHVNCIAVQGYGVEAGCAGLGAVGAVA